jgi:gas vesicle protein
MCDKDKSSIGFGVGLIIGVIGGIVAGVLYDPESGEAMREKVKDTVCDLAEKHSPAVKDAKKQAEEAAAKVKPAKAAKTTSPVYSLDNIQKPEVIQGAQ